MQFRHYLPSSHASVFLQRQGLRSIQNSMLRLLTINFLGRHVQGVRHVKTSSTVLLGSIRAVTWQLELQPSPNVVLTNLISSMSLNAYQRPQHILRQLKVCAASPASEANTGDCAQRGDGCFWVKSWSSLDIRFHPWGMEINEEWISTKNFQITICSPSQFDEKIAISKDGIAAAARVNAERSTLEVERGLLLGLTWG